MAHAITLSSNLGSSLLFSNMSATEALGRLFSYRLEAISKNAAVDLRALLGTPMTVKLVTPQGYTRYFNGIVCEGEQGGFVNIDNVRYAVYTFVLVPKPWLSTRRRDCRIYRSMSVPQIVQSVLGEIGYSDVKSSLSASYPARDYCVQYRESDFDFVSRLMEQEGIYYFFTHTDGTHTMVLADALGAHTAVSGFEQIPYAPPVERGKRMKASISDWETARSLNTTRVQIDDYDYLKPKASLLATEELTDKDEASNVSGLDAYDYAYGYVGHDQRLADGQRYAQVRADALNVPLFTSAGHTDACGLTTGALFRLKDFPTAEANQEYLVIETEMRLVEPDYVTGGGADDDQEPFRCSFKAIRSRQPFRAMAVTPRPVIAGLQTAVVYGDTPEDIAVDKYGRVQVTFFWSRPGKPNAQNSCPVRVAQMWAGKRWGAQFIPRVGQEVVVSFLDGNPDRPLIIGSVYNADNMPPYSLPDNKTQSGVKSRSHAGGGSEDYNEIRFEDKKGGEQVLIHAQKDLLEESEHDHNVQVAHNYTLSAGNQIKLVTGLASITMNSSGEIAIQGTSITINGDMNVTMSSGLAMEINSKANLNVSSIAAMEILSEADCLVQSTNLQLIGTATAILGGAAPMILPL
ncbi:Actin cross-linking toxin VgrG1 [Paraburkholderia kirstenboschensis]|uniref:type VI secretion system tip protein TssI/VgrG n=1 Tax=Paraburkholderia kirstenboschensis TaxID=1245436 RepID=UPI001A05ED6B|nr:type VI secretion system tip protein TssI/VgrG [Paraburkholderia kirstenboschensis]CAD6552072.1 Actin cross-linking toxin VgrG1 [Paraburkholderia kirstenboschensis]